mmetsp:Transcript_8192/g.24233  ORF Transcript_8192/g.24233 Transcript_8192/m.24233 type:complete len:812 (-) Transcript_8192:621-3056(-)
MGEPLDPALIDDCNLDGDDAIVAPDLDIEGAAAASDDECRHSPEAGEALPPSEGDGAPATQGGEKKKGKKKDWPCPSKGTRLLYVMMDVEFSHPTKALGEIFEVGARPYRVDVVGGAPFDLGSPMFKEQIEPSLEYSKAEFFWASSATTKTTRKDVEGKRHFPEVFADMKTSIETIRVKHNCETVVCCGWNWYTTDHHWLYLMCHRHGIAWPGTWIWGWDPLRSIQAHNKNRFRVVRAKKGEPAKAAPAGNSTTQLHDVYKAVTGSHMANHHHADADVNAAIANATHSAVWSRRYKSLKNHNGVYKLAEREDAIVEGFTKSREQVTPKLPEGWEEDPPGEAAACRPNTGSESGPSNRASANKERLADYWDLHVDLDFKGKVAKWSQFYAAGQVVKLVSHGAGKRQVFVPCPKTDPQARYRYRKRREGETLAQCKADFPEITADHVDLVLGIVQRGGALNNQSLYEAWITFDDNALRDACIADNCSRDNFALLWSVLCFVDYTTLQYDEKGYVVTDDPIVRVRKFIERAERNWSLNWTFGQYLCLDEYGVPGAQSRYCPIKMFNKDKPLKHHIDVIMMCDGQWNYPRFAHVFLKSGEKMYRLVMDHCWDAAWKDKNKVVFTDSRYCQMGLIKELHVQGCGFVSTLSPEAANKGRKMSKEGEAKAVAAAAAQQAMEASMTEEDRQAARRKRRKTSTKVMPFPPISKTVSDQLEYGWLRRARFDVPVDGSSETLSIESYVWKDSKIVGYASLLAIFLGRHMALPRGGKERTSAKCRPFWRSACTQRCTAGLTGLAAAQRCMASTSTLSLGTSTS